MADGPRDSREFSVQGIPQDVQVRAGRQVCDDGDGEPPQDASGVPAAGELPEDGYILVDTMDTLRQRLISYHFRFGDGRDARVGRTPHRYIWPSELDLMGRLAGLAAQVSVCCKSTNDG